MTIFNIFPKGLSGVAETNQTSGMDYFSKLVNGFRLFIIVAESSVLDVLLFLATLIFSKINEKS